MDLSNEAGVVPSSELLSSFLDDPLSPPPVTAFRGRGSRSKTPPEEQQRLVKARWRVGKTDAEIATELQVDRSRVSQIRKLLHLPANRRRTNDWQDWTPEEDAKLLRLKDEEYRNGHEIALTMGREAKECLSRYDFLISQEDRKTAVGPEKEKPCVFCRTPFTTFHPSRDWYCSTECRDKARSYSHCELYCDLSPEPA